MTIFFDFAIFFILIFAAYWIFIIVRTFFVKNEAKTIVYRLLITILLVFLFFLTFWGSFIEPRLIKITDVKINLNKTPEIETIKIAFLSDFHLGQYKKDRFMKKIVKKIKAEQPDLIIFGGDYILGREKESIHMEPLKQLTFLYPMYAVTGNHEFNQGHFGDTDYTDRTATIRKMFANWNIKFLDNSHEKITIHGKTFELVGIEDLWTKRADLAKAEAGLDQALPKILVSHNPDVILDPESKKFDLILSGHTHAGQIRLPLIGSVPNIPTQLGRKYDYGLYPLGSNFLYVSSGLGESGPRARLLAPPEIAIINLDL